MSQLLSGARVSSHCKYRCFCGAWGKSFHVLSQIWTSERVLVWGAPSRLVTQPLTDNHNLWNACVRCWHVVYDSEVWSLGGAGLERTLHFGDAIGVHSSLGAVQQWKDAILQTLWTTDRKTSVWNGSRRVTCGRFVTSPEGRERRSNEMTLSELLWET